MSEEQNKVQSFSNILVEGVDKITTPLQNLFYYIRDLYNTSDPCFDFEIETSNPKTENVNYWKISKLILLAKQSEQKRINEFSFAVGTKNIPIDYILKVKRISIPPEPQIPFEIIDWTLINRSSNLPTVSFKNEIEVVEKFEQSEQRVKDFEKYKQQAQGALFSLPLPPSLDGWIDFSDNKFLRRIEKKVIVLFTSNENRVRTASNFQKDFNEYYSKYETPLNTNKVYDSLHSLYYELKGRDNKRLYISFGLVCGKIGSQNYRNFLFNVPLKISLKSQEITLETDTFSSKIFCEQYFVELLDQHFKDEHITIIEQRKREVLLAIDNFNSRQKEFVFDKDFIRDEFYNKGLEVLSIFSKKEDNFFDNEDLCYDFNENTKSNQIAFSFSPIIQTKLVESQIAISKDADNIINKINELQASGTLHLIPDFFKKLFLLEGLEPEKKQHSDKGDNTTENNKHSDDYRDVNHRYLFPLPYNDEQLEIAKRLNEQDAVTVKGPPGTGKSHTIANLISHFVSLGKSILVVSHNAKALRVLKDKLPRTIQDLAVSLVNEGKGNESLKGSVNAIIRNLAQRYEDNKVTELEVQLISLERKYADTLNEIYKVVQANTKSYKLFNPITNKIEEKTAYEWAVFHFELNDYQTEIIKDSISHNTVTDGLVEKLISLSSIGDNLKKEDFELINFQFLSDDIFLELSELRKIETQIAEINEKINIFDYASIQPDALTENLKSEISNFEKLFEKYEQLTFPSVILKHPNYNFGQLKNILKLNESLRNLVKSADDKLLSFQIDLLVLDSIDPDILHQQINQLIVKFGDKKTITWVTKNLLDKNLKRFFECKVNFIHATEIEQFKIIETEINKRKCLKKLSITFNNYLKKFDFPIQENILEVLKELDFTVDFAEMIAKLNSELTLKNLPKISEDTTAVKSNLGYLKNIKYYSDYCNILNFLKEKKNKLISYNKAHPLIYKIAQAIENVDRASYELYLDEYRIRREKQLQSLKFDSLLKEISSIFPLTANEIKNFCLSDTKIHLNRAIIEKDIFFLKINDFLTTVTNKTKGSEKLLSDLQAIKRSIEKQTADIISYKTWYHKSKQVRDEEKSALTA